MSTLFKQINKVSGVAAVSWTREWTRDNIIKQIAINSDRHGLHNTV